MNGPRQSDGGIVPKKSPNTSQGVEGMEGRPPVKGKASQPPLPWTQSQEDGRPAALERIRQAVRRKRHDRLTSLYHHIYQVAHLREAYFALQRQAAPGVDGVTWQQSGQDLEANLSRPYRNGWHGERTGGRPCGGPIYRSPTAARDR